MHYYIIGIAGAGMSGIAHLLLDIGHQVSGSDPAAGPATAALSARGAVIGQDLDPALLASADALLLTSAARPDHPALALAGERGIKILKRADLWREWSQQRAVIAVAGSHGKTTTSAMIALGLRAAGVQAGYLIGAEIPDLGRAAAWGDPAAPLVIEADEYDRTFLALQPETAVITSVEWDHPDIYPSEAEYRAAFAQFASQARDPQRVILCGDDLGCQALGLSNALWYGIDEQLGRDPASCRIAPLDLSASHLRETASMSQFELWRYDRKRFATRLAGQQQLAVPGEHNVRNALAALAACALNGADLAVAGAALATFHGAARRFQLIGEAAGITIVDDYAHHPSEAAATISAARRRFPERRIVVYLQPHTFSRTAALRDQWPMALQGAALVLVGDVYAARETGDPAAVAAELAAQIATSGISARPVGDLAAAEAALRALLQPGDLLLTLGAGDGNRLGPALFAHYAIQ